MENLAEKKVGESLPSKLTDKTPDQYTMPELKQLIEDEEAMIAFSKARLKSLVDEVDKRTVEVFNGAFHTAGKITGTVKCTMDGVRISCEVTARDTWDQDKLHALREALPASRANALFKMELSIPRKIRDEVADNELMDRIEDACTTKFTQKVKFI